MIGHRLLANSLLCVGDFAEGLVHLDRALALYDPAAHRPLATRFGQDIGVAILSWRPFALWMLGYPGTALAEAARPFNAAREAGHAPTLIFALSCISYLLPRSCGSERATRRVLRLGPGKRRRALEGVGHGSAGLRIGFHRQSL